MPIFQFLVHGAGKMNNLLCSVGVLVIHLEVYGAMAVNYWMPIVSCKQ